MIPLGTLGSSHKAAPSGGGGFTYLSAGSSGTGNAAAQDVTALDFGAPAANRVIVAAIGTRVVSGRSLVSVTIGGVAATIDKVTSTWPSAIIARAVVPTGTSGTVTITMSGTEYGPRNVALFAAYGTVAVSGSGQHYSGATATSSTSVPNAAGAALVAVAQSTSSSVAFSWAGGLVEDVGIAAANSSMSATHANGLAAGPTSVSVTSGGATFQGLAAVAYAIT